MRKECSLKGVKICMEIIARQKHEKLRVNSPHTLQVYGVTYFYTEVQVRQRLLEKWNKLLLVILGSRTDHIYAWWLDRQNYFWLN
jgi:hypothetical protein